MKQLLIIFSLFIASAFVRAEEKRVCQFSLDCKTKDRNFVIDFKSPTNDCPEDDMEAFFTSEGRTTKLEIKKDWYFYTDHISKTQPSICAAADRINPFAAYEIAKDKVFLFVKSSGRPGYDNVHVLLLDTKAGAVINKAHLGNSKNAYLAVLKTKRGFKLRIIRDSLSFHDKVSCDCDAPFVDDWMEVSLTGNKIKSSWLVN